MSDDFFSQDADELNADEQEEQDPFADATEDQEVVEDANPFGEAETSTTSFSTEPAVDEFKFTREWNMQFRERCDAKDKEASEKRQEILNNAREDLLGWNKEREQKRMAKAEMNRQEEEKFVDGNAADISCKNPWERVAKLVEMNGDKNGDKSRMKQVMIRMKSDESN